MISKAKIIFFLSFSNILLVNVICFTAFCNYYSNVAWLYLIIYIGIFTFISFLFKGFPKKLNFLNYIKTKYFLRIIIMVYLFLITNTLLILSSIIIKKFFYFNASLLIIFSIMLFAAIIISSKGIKCIVSLGVLSFAFMAFFYLVPIIHSSERDFSYLLPLNFDISILFNGILLLVFPLENILFVLNHDAIKEGYSQKIFTISGIGCGIYLLFIIVDGITLTGVNFFQDLRYGGLYHWQLFQGNKFIENFDFLLLIILTTTSIFRLSVYLDSLKKLTFLKKSKYLSISFFAIFLLIGYILYFYINSLATIVKYLLIIASILILIIYLYISFLSIKTQKEPKYEQLQRDN